MFFKKIKKKKKKQNKKYLPKKKKRHVICIRKMKRAGEREKEVLVGVERNKI